jgi:galactosyl transferase GMA12/MNN10 family
MKIALLTVFDEGFKEIAERTLPTMQRYADAHGLELIHMSPDSAGRPPAWGKITRIREVLQRGFDYCFYVDADTIFVRFDRDIRDDIVAARDLHLCLHDPANSEDYFVAEPHLNTGVMIWRNCSWSTDFLDEVWRQTQFIHHYWWDQAAVLHLLGYDGNSGEAVTSRNNHVQILPVDWNVIVGMTVAPDPIIRHFAARNKTRRLSEIDREISLQPVRQSLPPELRSSLSRQLNLISFQEGRSQAEYDGLISSRSRLARALWRAYRTKLGWR